ncbi:MAG: LacI family transcriptional regulator [Thermotoga sp.]|nr:LacI family transcriptional regulator [Thermotoga sp.]
MKPRLVDIAKFLNISPSTVSKALNNKPGVRPELREKIIETARQLGYEKDIFANYLKTKQTKIIGLIIPDVSNYFFGRLVVSVEKALYEKGYRYVLFNTNEDEDKEEEYLRTSFLYKVDGMITVTSARSNKRKLLNLYRKFLLANKPVVFVDRVLESLGASYVVLDNVGAAFEAVEYLFKRGHRKIGAIMGPKGVYTAEKRLEGFLKALKILGLEYREDWILNGEFSMDVTEESVINAFKKMKDHPTALIAFNNLMAIGALEALDKLGFTIPDDISIITFDDMPWHKFLKVSLTSIAQPVEEIGVLAANILLNELENPKRRKSEVILKGCFIERSSVKTITDQ